MNIKFFLKIVFAMLLASNIYAANNIKEQVLLTHNQFRARHYAQPLVWDDRLAAYAERYANRCEFRHSSSPYGENLAAGYPTLAAAIKFWYDEGAHYSYSEPGFSMSTGHFTQVVWRATERIGCAYVSCDGRNGTQGKYLVCEYSPAGNITNSGYFDRNVLPSK
jgi:uncharacterized protein YkwD